jgi:hypothetical protein
MTDVRAAIFDLTPAIEAAGNADRLGRLVRGDRDGSMVRAFA